MPELHRVTNALGAGSYSAGMLPTLYEPCHQLGATSSMLTMGRFDFNRATASEPTSFGGDGIIDVSPSPKEILNAIGFRNKDEIAEENRSHWEGPAHRMIERVVEAVLSARLVDVQTMWLQGLRTGHGIPAQESLRELKTRVPRQFISVVSTIPENFDKRERLRDGYDLFVRLKDEGVVDTTFLVDNNSPFARTFKLNTQDQFEAKTLASLLASQVHFKKNPSLAEVGASLGDYGAFVGMAFASRSIVVTRDVLGWGALRSVLPWLPQRGHGEIANVILEAKEATRQALTEHKGLAIEETIDLERPFYVIYTVPLRLDQPRSWLEFSFEIRRWLANTYHTAVPVFASGNGTPDPRYSAPYWVQVAILFPMPDVPAPVRAILGGRETRRRANRAGLLRNGNGKIDPDPAEEYRVQEGPNRRRMSS